MKFKQKKKYSNVPRKSVMVWWFLQKVAKIIVVNYRRSSFSIFASVSREEHAKMDEFELFRKINFFHCIKLNPVSLQEQTRWKKEIEEYLIKKHQIKECLVFSEPIIEFESEIEKKPKVRKSPRGKKCQKRKHICSMCGIWTKCRNTLNVLKVTKMHAQKTVCAYFYVKVPFEKKRFIHSYIHRLRTDWEKMSSKRESFVLIIEKNPRSNSNKGKSTQANCFRVIFGCVKICSLIVFTICVVVFLWKTFAQNTEEDLHPTAISTSARTTTLSSVDNEIPTSPTFFNPVPWSMSIF